MAQYRVLKPIQYGNIAYFPSDYFGVDKSMKPHRPFPGPETTPSGTHGEPIPVDMSGLIELPDKVAAGLTLGQIASMDDPDTPIVSGYEVLGKALQNEQIKRGTEDKVIDSSGKEQWVGGAPRSVTTVSTEGTMRVG